ncbi:50S ribosomal protein L11 methyltransferase [Endozoicomonas ascidiicola]|uniref:50S ribosomal protein L11 methyltransferase n=1 Tax=Endozoicomonas ascidiicola TaxID=1698521 RepID=UPI000831E1A3|nr:50S ribosomal protein L11 methyltransferase [Endozoicomonas ascidiicola]
MSWIQVRLNTTSDHADRLEDLLLEVGASAVTLQDAEDQPVYEPELGTTPLWNNTVVIGLFDALTSVDHVVPFLKENAGLDPFPKHKVEIVEDKDWEREWMTHFHPMQFGDRLWVCPSWKPVPDPDAVNLMLDPGLAFGTGTHPTTALCLRWLDQQANLKGKEVIDYGCGSGILAIAALLLGAKSAIGVDLDPQALEATIENAKRNTISASKLDVFLPDDEPAEAADVVLANILAGPLTQLAPKLAGLTKAGGSITLSGILSEQAEEIIQTYKQWFDMEPPTTFDGWAMLSGTKRA